MRDVQRSFRAYRHVPKVIANLRVRLSLGCFQALERIAGLLEGSAGSIVLSERGDSSAIQRHPNFRLLAAMNPATDAGLHCLQNQQKISYCLQDTLAR